MGGRVQVPVLVGSAYIISRLPRILAKPLLCFEVLLVTILAGLHLHLHKCSSCSAQPGQHEDSMRLACANADLALHCNYCKQKTCMNCMQ